MSSPPFSVVSLRAWSANGTATGRSSPTRSSRKSSGSKRTYATSDWARPMRVIVVGLGVQGRKRLAVAGRDVVATVDPVNPEARYTRVEDVPPGAYDAALVCTPDEVKIGLLTEL